MADLKIKILIVDDMSTMRRIIKNALRQLGFTNLEEAEDGQQALNQVKQCPVDLIITDWNMPNMDGLDLLKAIREDPNTKEIPVLMVTAQAEQKHVLEAIQAGATNYIVKPFTADTLKGKIDKIFANK
ncbi:chemotaxis response regulator CheY [Nitrospira defluvii]|nr:chemotaxis response regulator CheY [Nitrospira defluvii]